MTKKLLLPLILCILICRPVRASEPQTVTIKKYWSDTYAWLDEDSNADLNAYVYLNDLSKTKDIDEKLDIKINKFRIYGYLVDKNDITTEITNVEQTKHGTLLELTIQINPDLDIENGSHHGHIELALTSNDDQIKIGDNEETLKFTLVVNQREPEPNDEIYDNTTPFWLYTYLFFI